MFKQFKRMLRPRGLFVFSLGTVLAISCTEQEDIIPSEPISAPLAAVSISNMGFESNWNDWNDVDPSSISGDSNSGSKSAKITGSGGGFSRNINVSANTDYDLACYVKGTWRFGVRINGSKTTRSGSTSNWKKETVSFNSGSATTITILAEYKSGGGDGRYDDFTLNSTGSGGGGGSNGALNVSSVSASADDGNVPANTLDGNLSTRWSANGSGQYITFDLGSSQNVGSVKVAWYKGDQRTSDYDIRIGNSTSSLASVKSGTSSGNTTSLETYNFTTTSGRYVRIKGFGNSSSNWNSITEVEIFAGSGNPDPDPDPDPDPSGSPASVLGGLVNWKLNGFSGTPSNNSYLDNVPNLSSYDNPDWFYTDGTRVFFRTFSGGATSSGSGNPRTELRELTSDGSDNITWNGTDNKTNRMVWKVRIVRLPSSGKIAFGQIHAKSGSSFDDVIRVQVQGSANQTSGQVRMRINGWVTESSNAGTDNDSETGFNFNMNEDLNLELIMKNKVVTLNLLNDNGSFNQQLFNHPSVNSNGNYFKAGCYLQSMSGKSYSASDNGVVAISSLSVSH